MLIIIGAICHLRYIASGIGISLCQQGSPLGPILFLLIFNIPHIIIRYFLTMIGYKSGTSLVEGARGGAILQKLSKGATIVGLMVIGDMSARRRPVPPARACARRSPSL